jgi:GNAT superfamily N-acetyltransferase
VSQNIEIQRLAAADGPAFFELRRQSIRRGCADYYPAADLEAWTDPKSDGQLPNPMPEEFYCAKLHGAIVASALIDVLTGDVGAMFVMPTHFGCGLGKAMLQRVIEAARQRALGTLKLDSTLNAVAFYRSRGFAGEVRGVFRSPRGVTLECVPMTMSLTV